MNQRTQSKSSLFLMELILAILFFSLAGAVCVQLFAKAHLSGEETVTQTHAVLWSQNLSEAFLACDGDMEQIKTWFPQGEAELSRFFLYFDANWEPCSKEEAFHQAFLEISSEKESFISASVSVGNAPLSQTYYQLSVHKYLQKGGGYYER